MELVPEMLAEITLKLENMRFKGFEESFERRNDKILNTKLPKLQFPVFKRNPLKCQSFYDQFNISIHPKKS